MNDGFTEYKGKRKTCSIYKNGILFFNAGAFRELNINKFKFVDIFVNKEKNAIRIKLLNESGVNSIGLLKKGNNHVSHSIHLKKVLNQMGIVKGRLPMSQMDLVDVDGMKDTYEVSLKGIEDV